MAFEVRLSMPVPSAGAAAALRHSSISGMRVGLWTVPLVCAFVVLIAAPPASGQLSVTASSPRNFVPTSVSIVTISGLSFGGTDTTPAAYAVGSPCQTTSWTSATSASCKSGSARSATPRNWNVELYLSVSPETASIAFSYDAPSISFAVQNSPASGGSCVTISGLNFLPSNYTSTAAIGGDAACGSTTWSSATSVMCGSVVPSCSDCTLAELRRSKVTVAAVVGTTRVLPGFSFDAPVVSHAFPNNPLTGGTIVTISGLNFGQLALTVSVALATNDCRTTSWSTATAVKCTAAPYAPILLLATGTLVVLTIEAALGTGLVSVTFDAPTVSGPFWNGAGSGRTSVTISGISFGVNDLTSTAGMLQGYRDCHTTSWSTGTSVLCL